MPRRENTFRVDYSQFPKYPSHDEIHKFIAKELGLTRENVLQLQPSKRLGCTFVKVNNLELAEKITEQHDGKHEFVFDGKPYKLRITMEDGAVEVKFFDLPEGVSNEQIEACLVEYGDVIYVRDLLWDDRYGDFGGVKTGVRIARVVVTKNIPSLVTIEGEETAVTYKGQRQTCLHCHEFVHIGIPCVQNKKLLVQKLAADQSYANVAKGKPKTPVPNKPQSPSLNAMRLRTDVPATGKPSTSGLPSSFPAPNKTQTVPTKPKTSMPPPATPAAAASKPSATQAFLQLISATTPSDLNPSHHKTDGSETDSSQASNNTRRSRRQPPGKKMRHSGENTNTNTITTSSITTSTTTEHDHASVSD